nr:hypothetical protein [Tanacetum cinerariifolium]
PPAAATWQLPIGQPPVTWQLRQHRSTPSVNDGQRHRSTAAVHGGDRRSMVAVNDGLRWQTTVDCRWTTGPSVNGGWWAGQRAGLGRVWIGSATLHATCQPRVHTCAYVASTWQLTWIISTRWESNAAP